MQKCHNGVDNSAAIMEKRKSCVLQERPTDAPIEGMVEGDGDGMPDGDDVKFITREGFFKQPHDLRGARARKLRSRFL